jgi:subtilisin family serine protease
MKASAALVVLAAACLLVSSASAAPRDHSSTRYTVAFTSTTLPSNVDQLVAAAGGKIVDRLTQLGAVSVVSSDPSFASKIAKTTGVAGANLALRTSILPSGLASTKLKWQDTSSAAGQRRHDDGQKLGRDPQPMPDPLGSLQWDKMRMDVSTNGSYRVNRGRNDVVVAFTDTGVDVNHPDIQPNLDLADSRSFITAPDPNDPDSGYTVPEDYVGVQDYNGHGTWVTSAVAAPINRIGISGVAPNVTTVALKTQDALGNGFLSDWADAVRYAANMGVDVVSSSIYAYVPTCAGVPDDVCDGNDADYLVAQRAVDYARSKGTVVVAALGNENLDVSNPVLVHDFARDFLLGFDFPGPWLSVPGTLHGVVGVSATGYFNDKASYSNYGLGAVDVAAPGGDHATQNPGDQGSGTLIGAWSSTSLVDLPNPVPPVTSCYRGTCGLYVFDQGTSMATPNVAGIAALIISQYGTGGRDNGGKHNGWGGDGETGRNRPQAKLSPDRVEKILTGTAVQRPCPTPPIVVYPGQFPYDTATCQGSPSNNGFFGHGIVNALGALGAGQSDNR